MGCPQIVLYFPSPPLPGMDIVRDWMTTDADCAAYKTLRTALADESPPHLVGIGIDMTHKFAGATEEVASTKDFPGQTTHVAIVWSGLAESIAAQKRGPDTSFLVDMQQTLHRQRQRARNTNVRVALFVLWSPEAETDRCAARFIRSAIQLHQQVSNAEICVANKSDTTDSLRTKIERWVSKGAVRLGTT